MISGGSNLPVHLPVEELVREFSLFDQFSSGTHFLKQDREKKAHNNDSRFWESVEKITKLQSCVRLSIFGNQKHSKSIVFVVQNLEIARARQQRRQKKKNVYVWWGNMNDGEGGEGGGQKTKANMTGTTTVL